jgi:hypothetical protein
MNRKTIHPQAMFCRVMFDAKTELQGQPALPAVGFTEDGGLRDIMTTQLSWNNVAKTHALLEFGKMCGKVVFDRGRILSSMMRMAGSWESHCISLLPCMLLVTFVLTFLL